MSNKQINEMTTEEYQMAIMQIVSSGLGWSAVKDILGNLERKEDFRNVVYCDATARLKAIGKIAESSQTPKQKIKGIKALADMRGDTE